MNHILDQFGRPIGPDSTFRVRKAEQPVKSPIIGDGFGIWAGRDSPYVRLPGGAVLQFDLNRLTMADYRQMRDHYQISASLNVLSFGLFQMDWRLEGGLEESRKLIEEELQTHWARLVRSFSTAHWAGYSPNAINYHNAVDGKTRIKSIKDLVPEEAVVNWREEEGWAPPGKVKPKIRHYDGLIHCGHWIPPENTLWYPLLMENGDFYGRKLLKAAFMPWYFSMLIHLYTNRYFERFGEPTPIGRADFHTEIDMGGGQTVNGRKAMEAVVSGFRNGATVVLPSDRDPITKEYDFDLDYVESQMRGADWERYLSRLDEEMSMAVFTPILLFRTADVGSYDLGKQHMLVFQQMLTALAADWKYYIDTFIIKRLHALNYPGNYEYPTWVARKQGGSDVERYKEVFVEMIRKDRAVPDLRELSDISGITWEEAEIITGGGTEMGADPATDANEDDPERGTFNLGTVRGVLDEAARRTANTLVKGGLVTLSHRNRVIEALTSSGMAQDDAVSFQENLYGKVNAFLTDLSTVDVTAEEAHQYIMSVVDGEL